MGQLALVDEGLKVAVSLQSIGRIHVDHLHLPAESLVMQQRIHHDLAPDIVCGFCPEGVAFYRLRHLGDSMADLPLFRMILAAPSLPLLISPGSNHVT